MRSLTPSLSVGILAADLLRLGDELESLRQAGVNVVHIDAMDGVFCPQLTVGPAFVRAIPDSFVKDVHLMVDEPLGKVEEYVDAGATIITTHVEASRHPHRVLQSLRGAGVVRGVALNPGTPVPALEPLLDEIELVLVLGVNPGWSGQRLVTTTAARVTRVRELIRDRDVLLAVDGGVTASNIHELATLNVDLVVAGSAVYETRSPAQTAGAMLEAVRSNPAVQS